MTLPFETRKMDLALKCPFCDEVLDGLGGFYDAILPSAGDVSVCMECVNLIVFDVLPGLGGTPFLRKPTDDEVVAYAGDKDVIAMVEVISLAKRRRDHGDDWEPDEADRAAYRKLQAAFGGEQ